MDKEERLLDMVAYWQRLYEEEKKLEEGKSYRVAYKVFLTASLMRSNCCGMYNTLFVRTLEHESLRLARPDGVTSPTYCQSRMFSPYALARMRALKGLACHARVTSASSHALPEQGEALTSPACRACGRASPFRTRLWLRQSFSSRTLFSSQ